MLRKRCGCHVFFSGPVRVFVLGVFKGAVVHTARGGVCGLRRVAIWICWLCCAHTSYQSLRAEILQAHNYRYQCGAKRTAGSSKKHSYYEALSEAGLKKRPQ